MNDDLQKRLSSLCEISKVHLAKILGPANKHKNLILDPNIIKPLEKICGAKWLREQGIQKIYKLEGNLTVPNNIPQYYLIHSNLDIYQTTLDFIQAQVNINSTIEPAPSNVEDFYHIILCPKALSHYEDALESCGLYGIVQLHSFQWYPIFLDKSLLTLEYPNFYRNLYVHNNLSLLPVYARSMWQLFFVFGEPKFCLTVGALSKMVFEQLKVLRHTLGGCPERPTEIGGMLVIDRNVDYTSAFLTPSTYSGLLNEITDINCGVYAIQNDEHPETNGKFMVVPKINSSVRFSLDSNTDTLYNEIKHQHFSVVTATLSKLTKKLKQRGESLSQEWTVQDGKQFVSRDLKDIVATKQKVNNHLQAAETVMNFLGTRFERQHEVEENLLQNKQRGANYQYLEEMLTVENNRHASLRLMCLMAVTQRLSYYEFMAFFDKYLLEFGYNLGYVYNNLKRANFVNEPPTAKDTDFFMKKINNMLLASATPSASNFIGNATRLKQIPKDSAQVDVKNPNCCSYVFGGIYVPLVATLTGMLLNSTPVKEMLAKLEHLGAEVSVDGEMHYPLAKRSLLVYVIGGVTYAEVAACDLLEKLLGCHVVVVSDRVVSGNGVVDALLQHI